MPDTSLLYTASRFLTNTRPVDAVPVDGGLINRSFRITDHLGSYYLLQQVNTAVFPSPKAIQDNILVVAQHLKANAYPLFVPELLTTADGETLFQHGAGAVWRMMTFAREGIRMPALTHASMAFEAAKAVGLFHRTLDGLDPQRLHIPIPGFLDVRDRINQLHEAIRKAGIPPTKKAEAAVKGVLHSTDLVQEYTAYTETQPVRILHADPKLANMLFHPETGAVTAIIDWDTLMPGPILYDVGDMVRSLSGNTLSIPTFNTDVYRALEAGYRDATKGWLGEAELGRFLHAAMAVTAVQAARFLTDYLSGNAYYKTDYPEHNLDRALRQLELLDGMKAYAGD
jgi:Ser/Thr protein kinase RdoA (MazF antagonist)